MEAGVEVLERPKESPTETKPYSEQEVVYYHGGRFERIKRSEVVRRYLEWIHPSLAKWAEKFGPGKDQIKDISHPDYLNPEYTQGEHDTLEPKGLVLIHLTNTFPEDGVIRPTGYYRPETLRFSLHFSVNGPVVEEAPYGMGEWKRRRYAILIPFEKVMSRIEEFRPGDTIVMDELELPEGSLILAGNVAHLPKNPKKAGKAEIAVENFGKTSQDLRLAVYRGILSMGYCPLQQGSHDNWVNWFSTSGAKVFEEFTTRYNIRFGSGHAYHWSHELEGFANGFLWAREEKNQNLMKNYLYGAKQFLEARENVPQKYKDQLRELMDKYQNGQN